MHTITTRKILAPTIEEPIKLKPWLHHPHSLTDKLKDLKGHVDLRLLSQEWVLPSWWGKYRLGIKDPLVFQRDILMQSGQVAYWFARSLIPKSCYDQDVAFFNRLEKESIRNLIFDSPDVERVDFMVYPIDKQCIEYYWVNHYLPVPERRLWVRFSEISYRQKTSFYLLEILLPSLENDS